MDDNKEEDFSLAALYDKVMHLWSGLQKEYTDASSTECLRLLADLQHKIDVLGLYSWNEEIDDLATSSIRYFHVEFWLGMTLLERHTADLSQRQKDLLVAQEYLETFLKRLRSYRLLDQEVTSLLATPPPQTVREVKIARMRKIKSLNGQIAACEEMAGEFPEEVEREMQLVRLSISALKAQNNLESIEDELNILQQRSESKLDGAHSDAPKSPPMPSASRPSNVTRIARPFLLVKDRQQLTRDVFRPDYNLPTMTIDEYLELERRRGGIVEGQANPKANPDPDLDRDEEADAQTLKDRQWDLFKDDNPVGWGNTYNLS